MLVELGVVEQRYRAVLEVLEDGAPVTEVARRYGVARQTVHEWLARYADTAAWGGWRTGRRGRRRARTRCRRRWRRGSRACGGMHPAWGPSRIRWELEREGREPLPGRSRSTGRWSAMGWWRRRTQAAAGGLPRWDAAGRCSCGRWT